MTFVSGPFFCCIQLSALSFCPIVRTHRCPFLWIKYFIYGISSIENSIRCGCTKWRDAICKRRATTTTTIIIKKNRKIWRKPIQYVIYALKSSYCLLFEWRHFYRAFVCGAVKKHYKFLLLWRYFRLFSLSHNSIIKKILFNGFSWIFSGGLALFFSFNFRVCC